QSGRSDPASSVGVAQTRAGDLFPAGKTVKITYISFQNGKPQPRPVNALVSYDRTIAWPFPPKLIRTQAAGITVQADGFTQVMEDGHTAVFLVNRKQLSIVIPPDNLGFGNPP